MPSSSSPPPYSLSPPPRLFRALRTQAGPMLWGTPAVPPGLRPPGDGGRERLARGRRLRSQRDPPLSPSRRLQLRGTRQGPREHRGLAGRWPRAGHFRRGCEAFRGRARLGRSRARGRDTPGVSAGVAARVGWAGFGSSLLPHGRPAPRLPVTPTSLAPRAGTSAGSAPGRARFLGTRAVVPAPRCAFRHRRAFVLHPSLLFPTPRLTRAAPRWPCPPAWTTPQCP